MLKDWTVNRVYKCQNKECQGEILVEQLCGDDWLTQCPFCEQESLLLKSGDCGVSIIIDATKPKTLGALAEKNTRERQKYEELPEGFKKKGKKPWWRKKDKIDYSILKNPQKYIETGKI